MVIIELYKPHVTRYKYIEENEEFSKSKVILFYKKFQTYFPILNVQTYNCILGGDILYACAKFQLRNNIIEDNLKKKTMSAEFMMAQ